MSDTSTYQLALKFDFLQDFTHQVLQLTITDGNGFVITSGKQAQLQPYMSVTTPPLATFELSQQLVFVNVAEAAAGEGVELLLWSSFSPGHGGATLAVSTGYPAGLVHATYAVLDTASSGTLTAGDSVITAQQ